jgi:hypothetical protein
LPVFLLTNRVGKMFGRPRNSERNSFTLSAGVYGALPFVASGRDNGGGADAVASSDRRHSIRARASSRVRSSSASRCSSRARS